MTFDDKLNELINEVEVPDELSPQNIARMLKAQSAQSKMEAEHRNIKSAPSAAAQRRTIIMRTAAATAACAVFAVGMIALNRDDGISGNIDEQIDYAAVSPVYPGSYEELYNIYTGIYLDGNTSGDGEDAGTDREPDTADEPISEKRSEPAETLTDVSEYDFSGVNDSRVSGADITGTDGTNLYCINGSKLYVVSLETMEVTAEIENKLNPPVELYIDNDMLILVSKENEEVQAEDITDGSVISDGQNISRSNVIADIYDISDKAAPVKTISYKQNGSYITSKLSDGILYMVSGYRDYRSAPLDENMDLDSYVPAYYIGGEKKYVAAGDITVPANANSTDYTVLAAINLRDGVSATVKAVLGSSRNVYCSADTLYVTGVGKSKNNEDYSVISSFDLSGDGMTYKASASVAGRVINRSMNEYNGMFRIAAESADENGTYTSVYVLDDTLTVVNSAGQLLNGQKVNSVRFEDSYAILYTDGNAPAMIIDLASNPPVQTQSLAASSAYLYEFSDGRLLGLGKSEDGLTLTMYSGENGLMMNNISFAEGLGSLDSKALYDRRALLIDTAKSLIGVPVYSHNEFGTKNLYYVFSYDDEAGFVSKGVIEYNDLDDSGIFERASVNGENLYIIGGSRIVSVRISDMKVVDSIEF